MIRKYAEIFCWKNVSSFCSAKATHIFSAKNIRILYNESAKTVNEMKRARKANDALNNWAQKNIYLETLGRIQEDFLFNLIILRYLLYVFGQTGLCKQCRPRSDAAEWIIWSGFTLFATHPVILTTFIGSYGLVEEKYREKCPKFIQNLQWIWNFESKLGSTEPSESSPDTLLSRAMFNIHFFCKRK